VRSLVRETESPDSVILVGLVSEHREARRRLARIFYERIINEIDPDNLRVVLVLANEVAPSIQAQDTKPRREHVAQAEPRLHRQRRCGLVAVYEIQRTCTGFRKSVDISFYVIDDLTP